MVIDDIFGDPVDDPEFSVENEGFQEVTSKKAQKMKQKAQQEAELKRQIMTEKQKKEAHNKVINVLLKEDTLGLKLGYFLIINQRNVKDCSLAKCI